LQQVTQSEEATDRVQHIFKGIWSLEDFGKDGAEVNAVVQKAIENPHDFVLKP